MIPIEEKEHHEKKESHGEHKAASKRDETITVSKVTVWKAISGVLAVLLALSVFTGGFGLGVNTTGNAAAPAADNAAAPSAPSAPSGAAVVDMEALIDDDEVKGDPDAPVTIVEFSDFECPFCARFYSQTLKQIEEQYIDTGKVKLVYRDFPLSFHANAQKAAEAAECAGEQGKYWEMHDVLFEKGMGSGVPTFKSYAADLGLDQASFDSCLDNGDQAAEVQADFRAGGAAGIRGTPGFIVNGQVISGAQPFSVFQQAIEAHLN